MTARRTFLKGMSVLPASTIFPFPEAEPESTAGRDYFKEIGVKPFINGLIHIRQ